MIHSMSSADNASRPCLSRRPSAARKFFTIWTFFSMLIDLVITADTALAHLAGALGVPVWVVLQAVPDRRWLTERGESPWYPSMRLFSQRTPGDWREVLDR